MTGWQFTCKNCSFISTTKISVKHLLLSPSELPWKSLCNPSHTHKQPCNAMLLFTFYVSFLLSNVVGSSQKGRGSSLYVSPMLSFLPGTWLMADKHLIWKQKTCLCVTQSSAHLKLWGHSWSQLNGQWKVFVFKRLGPYITKTRTEKVIHAYVICQCEHCDVVMEIYKYLQLCKRYQ